MRITKKSGVRILTGVLIAALFLSLCGVYGSTAMTDYDLSTQSGGLQITEAGTYTLTGKLTGTVTVSEKAGNVTLVLDGADINGSPSAGIVILGESPVTIRLRENSVNRIVGCGEGSVYGGAIFSKSGLTLTGSGTAYIASSAGSGIYTENADMTVEDGTYVIGAGRYGLEAEGKNAGTIFLNGGTVKAEGVSPVDPFAKVRYNGASVIDLSQKSSLTEGTESVTADTEETTEETSEETSEGTSEETSEETTEQTSEETTEEASEQTSEETSEETTEQTSEETKKETTEEIKEETKQETTEPEAEEQKETSPDFPQRQDGKQEEKTVLPEERQQPGENPGESTQQEQGAQPPEIPDGETQPGQQSQDPGQQGQDQGGLQNVEYAEEPTEIVTSTMENTAADLEASTDNITYLEISDENSQIEIKSSGTYSVSGTCSDGNITVKKGTEGVVLILDNVDLTSTTGAAVSVNKNAEVKIIVKGEVVLTDNEDPEDENSEDESVADAFDGAALKAKSGSKVYITGDGDENTTLTINGNSKNGIKAGEDSIMEIDGVIVNITAVNDGINSGYDLTLLGGDFTISAGDDAIHADHILTIGKENSEDGDGPVIRVTKSYEGLEGSVVNIFGGDLTVNAEDDAVNAANSDGTYEEELDYSINMTGGKLTVISNSGDGLDSNGNINLIGGSATINSVYQGGEAGIDYDGQYYQSEDFKLQNNSGIAGPDGEQGQQGQEQGQQGQDPGQQSQEQGQQSQEQDQQGQEQSQQAQEQGQQGQDPGQQSQEQGQQGQNPGQQAQDPGQQGQQGQEQGQQGQNPGQQGQQGQNPGQQSQSQPQPQSQSQGQQPPEIPSGETPQQNPEE